MSKLSNTKYKSYNYEILKREIKSRNNEILSNYYIRNKNIMW